MAVVTQIFTGLQPFWSYDSFSLAPRMIGGGTGYINLSGAKWSIDESSDYKDPAERPTVTIDEDMNFMFSTSDIQLKFQNNSPSLTRFYNTTENLHTGSGAGCDSLPCHMGLMGRHWIFNYEHCFIHSDSDTTDAIEIGPTGERNTWVYNSVSSGIESFDTPNGIDKKLTRDTANSRFTLTTPGYYKYVFDKKDQVPGGADYYQRLSYIESPTGVRQYVEWENKATGYSNGGPISRYRIKQISISTDGGNTKIALIKFRYVGWAYEVDQAVVDAFHLVRTMRDQSGREWRYTYDFDTETTNIGAKLTQVTYPDGYNQKYAYSLVGTDDIDNYLMTTLTDRNGNNREISYSSNYWRIDLDTSSSTDYATTSYAWSVDSTTFYQPDSTQQAQVTHPQPLTGLSSAPKPQPIPMSGIIT
jgi:hypothetical protein